VEEARGPSTVVARRRGAWRAAVSFAYDFRRVANIHLRSDWYSQRFDFLNGRILSFLMKCASDEVRGRDGRQLTFFTSL
jgi:hypothetical protein